MSPMRPQAPPALRLLLVACALCAPEARASFLSGEALDTAADVIAWIALIVVPVALISVFWLVHILPEKIAEKRRHPQLAAIKTLCLLSLLFGGLLWPLAWLWAYTKPVLHKLAYGTDQDDHASHGEPLTPLDDARGDARAPAAAATPPASALTPAAPATPDPGPGPEWRERLEALDRRLAAMEASRPERPTGMEG